METRGSQSTLVTELSTFEYQQRNTETRSGNCYNTTGLLTCLTVSIIEYDNPSVENRSGAQKVRHNSNNYK